MTTYTGKTFWLVQRDLHKNGKNWPLSPANVCLHVEVVRIEFAQPSIAKFYADLPNLSVRKGAPQQLTNNKVCLYSHVTNHYYLTVVLVEIDTRLISVTNPSRFFYSKCLLLFFKVIFAFLNHGMSKIK